MKTSISILGSTGSIGSNVLKIIEKKRKYFHLNVFSSNKNFSIICKQIKKYKPKYFVVTDNVIFKKVKNKFSANKIIILNNYDKIDKFLKNDVTVSAIPGLAGLNPTIIFTRSSKKILIANKEAVICGWNLIKKEAKKRKTKIIPIDSEHFSIMKLMENHNLNQIDKVYLTASGGPFLNYKIKKFKKIKPLDALRHPRWKMGKKISVDSSTLMNKIFELIEAEKIFNIPLSKLDILIHPNSLVHAIIKFKNGLYKIIYHQTSMIIPLANAIFNDDVNIVDFFNKKEIKRDKAQFIQNLIFKKVDVKIFPVFRLKKRLNEYPSTPIIINAANEILVDQFLQKNISFLSISKFIMNILKDRNYIKYAIRKPKNIKEISTIDNWARTEILKKIK